MKLYYVYIMASWHRVLYIGITSDLGTRLAWHRSGANKKSFTTQYQVYRLVYVEEYAEVSQAIAVEKQLKSWRRGKKLRLIERSNREWLDLAPPCSLGPSPRSG